MEYRSCPECNQQLAGNETSCPTCGYPLNRQTSTPYNQLIQDEGDNDAETLLRNVLNWIKILIIIFSFVPAIALIVLDVNNSDVPILGIIGAVIIVLLGTGIARLVWAAGMIFINISTNVRKIKQILQSK